MTETQAIAASHDPNLQQRVAFSLAKTAIAKHGTGTAAEIALASKVSLAPESYALAFCITIFANLTGAALAAVTDIPSISQATIDSNVASVWGVFT